MQTPVETDGYLLRKMVEQAREDRLDQTEYQPILAKCKEAARKEKTTSEWITTSLLDEWTLNKLKNNNIMCVLSSLQVNDNYVYMLNWKQSNK
jgi:hypothetical protein